MAPNPRVANAFRAMRQIGIAEEICKPVLKSLLKLYEKKWEFIEEENYRALADAIFDAQDSEAAEKKKKLDNPEREVGLEEEAPVHEEEERERPSKRRRQEVLASNEKSSAQQAGAVETTHPDATKRIESDSTTPGRLKDRGRTFNNGFS